MILPAQARFFFRFSSFRFALEIRPGFRKRIIDSTVADLATDARVSKFSPCLRSPRIKVPPPPRIALSRQALAPLAGYSNGR